jgi:CelD/BcsL family acetyltransferase involved in cellulose biosynthesis
MSQSALPSSAADTLVPQQAAPHDAATTLTAADLKVTVYDSLTAVEAVWRRFEARAVSTPYQAYDWLKSLLETRGIGRSRLIIAVIEDADGPVAILPLAVSRRFGMALGSLVGFEIGNVGWMPVDPAIVPRLTRPVLDQVLRDIVRQAGGRLDALSLNALPATWRGHANPLLAYPHQPGPDHLFVAPIGPGAEPRANQKRIRNILRGKRRLAELMGPVVLRAAQTPEEVEEYHAVFQAQRAARFAEQGIANVFAADWFVRFFRDTAVASLGSARPALRFHALYAGDEIVATSCGTYFGTHFSQYINSTTSGQAAKSSLMGLLMLMLIEELEGEGLGSIDMGLGDFEYKKDWTDPVPVYDAVIPLTLWGRLGGSVLLAARSAKRFVKQHDRLWTLVKALRARLGRKRQPAPAQPD